MFVTLSEEGCWKGRCPPSRATSLWLALSFHPLGDFKVRGGEDGKSPLWVPQVFPHRAGHGCCWWDGGESSGSYIREGAGEPGGASLATPILLRSQGLITTGANLEADTEMKSPGRGPYPYCALDVITTTVTAKGRQVLGIKRRAFDTEKRRILAEKPGCTLGSTQDEPRGCPKFS